MKDASNTLIPVVRAKISVRVAPGDTSASAMDAFGNLVSALTEMPIEPLPSTPDLPTGAGTTPKAATTAASPRSIR